jgi:hypothetical protein
MRREGAAELVSQRARRTRDDKGWELDLTITLHDSGLVQVEPGHLLGDREAGWPDVAGHLMNVLSAFRDFTDRKLAPAKLAPAELARNLVPKQDVVPGAHERDAQWIP